MPRNRSAAGLVTDPKFWNIEARCRLKAEAARWAASRGKSDEADPAFRDFVSKGKAAGCFLWMIHLVPTTTTESKALEDIAGCFDALAYAVSVLKSFNDELLQHRNEIESFLNLLAEAQSALQAGVAVVNPKPDDDQVSVFIWLYQTANEQTIFLEHFMREGELADPAQWRGLSSRILDVATRLQSIQVATKRRQRLLGNVRHKISLIQQQSDGGAIEWSTLASVVDQLVVEGLPPSNVELRELLLPVIYQVPDMPIPNGFRLALRELDEFLLANIPTKIDTASVLSSEVIMVARLLKGRSMVLIGGSRRPGSYESLRNEFGLKDLIWIQTKEHQSISTFESDVRTKDVDVVLLAIRWSSHSFGGVKVICDLHGKHFVRLKAGCSPNQVAKAILDQCGQKLKPRIDRLAQSNAGESHQSLTS